MHTRPADFSLDSISCKPQQQFRLQFQRELQRYLNRHHSVAEGFGIIWEKTLQQVPLDDHQQGSLYKELLAWARSDDLFTEREDYDLLRCWRETVHEC